MDRYSNDESNEYGPRIMGFENLYHDTLEEFEFYCKSLASQFDFFTLYGFVKDKECWPKTNSFKDGFHVHFQKAGFGISVEYLDMEFDIKFEIEDKIISYYFIDKELFQNKSGFQGSMFPREKLPVAISVVAKEIKEGFGNILEGESKAWDSILIKYRAPEIKKRKLPG